MVDLTRARDALKDAFDTLDVLEAGCCAPNRSPRMAALRATLRDADDRLNTLTAADGRSLLDVLEKAGAQIGSLQVACCAPARLPLYARMLEDLTTSQRTVTSRFEFDH